MGNCQGPQNSISGSFGSTASATSRYAGSSMVSGRRNAGFSVLHIEVVRLANIGRPQARSFDIIKRGCCRAAGRPVMLNVYVEITFGNGRCWTNSVQVEEGGEADFGRSSLAFMVTKQLLSSPRSQLALAASTQEGSRRITARVFHHRLSTTGLRGDPELGSATFELGFLDVCGVKREVPLPIMRRGRPQGELTLSYSVRPEREAYSIISTPSDHTLCEVADALAQILSGEDGLDILYDSLPEALMTPGGKDNAQSDLQSLLVSLCNQVGMLAGETDAEVLERFARLSHSVQSYVSHCLQSHGRSMDRVSSASADSSQAEVARLAGEWIAKIFTQCVQRSDTLCGHMPNLRDERVKRFLKAGRQFPSLNDLVPVDKNGCESFGWAGFSVNVPNSAVINTGAQGEVWRARDVRSGVTYAVKTSWKRHNPVDKRERELVDHVLMAPHPCIVHLLGAFVHNGSSVIVMELCTQGNLHDLIVHHVDSCTGSDYTPPALANRWFSQMFLGLEHLHLKLHTLVRDLKPHNVILTDNGRAKLTDFGHGRIGNRASGAFTLHFGPPGSRHFVAPEVVLRKPYDFKSDIYSLGVVLWVLLTGGLKRTPAYPPMRAMAHEHDYEVLAGNSKMLEQAINHPLRNGARLLPDAASRELVLKLTSERMASRLDHEQIRSHRFMEPLPAQGAHVQEVERWLRGSGGSRLGFGEGQAPGREAHVGSLGSHGAGSQSSTPFLGESPDGFVQRRKTRSGDTGHRSSSTPRLTTLKGRTRSGSYSNDSWEPSV